MNYLRHFWILFFLMSCSAATYYSSPNIHASKNLAESDTIIIRTKSSSVFIESSSETSAKIEWKFPKKLKNHYALDVKQTGSNALISDELRSESVLETYPHIHVFAPAGTVVQIENKQGNTFVNHSGVVAAQSEQGSITFYMVRDHFWALNKTGSIQVGISDIYNHSGFIESESGKVLVVTGAKSNELHVKRSDAETPLFIKEFKPVETSFDFPFLYIQSLSDSTTITKAGTLLWK
ncbi:hypothetical protein EP331_04190 [bacterium]|nr:MAG: hypothetical protein EP331_04190 [bacterium]